ncbi:MAG TPA: hypothetical protein VH092_20820, partial [Urbifossiella sp.]|nr:hypothetical protein [Urbifossiella sp.]
MNVPPPVRSLLDWHQGRRAGGIPTVTILAGPVNLAIRTWRGWAGSRPASVVRAVAAPDDWAAAWASDTLSASPGLAHARSWLARVTGQDPAAVTRDTDRMTRYDLERLWRSLPLDPTEPVAAAAFLLLAAHAAGAAPDPVEITRELSGGGVGGVFRGLCGLYPQHLWPALLVVPAPGQASGWLSRSISALEGITTAVPALPVAMAATRAACEALAADTHSHTAAVAREGHISVEGITAGDLDARLRAAGVVPPPAAATLGRLVADGLADDIAAAFVEAARAVRNPTPADVASDFRSVHEQFLFEQLESLPET